MIEGGVRRCGGQQHGGEEGSEHHGETALHLMRKLTLARLQFVQADARNPGIDEVTHGMLR